MAIWIPAGAVTILVALNKVLNKAIQREKAKAKQRNKESTKEKEEPDPAASCHDIGKEAADIDFDELLKREFPSVSASHFYGEIDEVCSRLSEEDRELFQSNLEHLLSFLTHCQEVGGLKIQHLLTLALTAKNCSKKYGSPVSALPDFAKELEDQLLKEIELASLSLEQRNSARQATVRLLKVLFPQEQPIKDKDFVNEKVC